VPTTLEAEAADAWPLSIVFQDSLAEPITLDGSGECAIDLYGARGSLRGDRWALTPREDVPVIVDGRLVAPGQWASLAVGSRVVVGGREGMVSVAWTGRWYGWLWAVHHSMGFLIHG